MHRFIFLFLLIILPIFAACTGDSATELTVEIVTPPVTTPVSTVARTTAPRATATLLPATATPQPAIEASPTAETLPTIEPDPTDTPTPDPTVIPVVFPPSISLKPFVSVPNQITYLTHAGDGSGRIFLVEKQGRVRIIEGGRVLEAPFLDISDLVESGGSEQGLLSIAFDPDFENNGEFYVNYTSRTGDGDTTIARYRVSVDPNTADASSGEVLLTIDQPARNHNGGQIQFGPDGNLYIGTGDGGQANDPWDNAENRGVLLGKMLRIAVQGQETYAIPHDNPFIEQTDIRAEIWAYGLRNPWRFSFDSDTDDLYIADVGQNMWEEIDYQPAQSTGGEHYGWDTTEGFHCFEPATGCDTSAITLPVVEYGHDRGCSITGGYVYRGAAHSQLDGIYFYADFCSGDIWALRQTDDGNWQDEVVFDSDYRIASFGQDEAGELYILDLNGAVYRLQTTDDL
jgi:glucose/arabinose dehydrogenase